MLDSSSFFLPSSPFSFPSFPPPSFFKRSLSPYIVLGPGFGPGKREVNPITVPASEVLRLGMGQGVVRADANPCCPGPKHSGRAPSKDCVLPWAMESGVLKVGQEFPSRRGGARHSRRKVTAAGAGAAYATQSSPGRCPGAASAEPRSSDFLQAASAPEAMSAQDLPALLGSLPLEPRKGLQCWVGPAPEFPIVSCVSSATHSCNCLGLPSREQHGEYQPYFLEAVDSLCCKNLTVPINSATSSGGGGRGATVIHIPQSPNTPHY